MKTQSDSTPTIRPLSWRWVLLMLMTLACALSLQASTDYGPAVWRPTCNANYFTSGYGKKFHVVHDMEGYYASSISMYVSCSYTAAGMHYWVNGKKDRDSDSAPGAITQTTREAYYAWHAVCWNKHSTGTEHEGFVSNPAWWTPELYQASALLTQHLADKFGITKDRNHIIAHGQKSVAGWPAFASAHFGIDPYCNSHTDPGPYWNWTHYMNLVNGGPPPPTTINPPYTWDSNAQGWTAGNSISPVAWIGTGWPGVIYNDQTGVDAFNYSPPCSFAGGVDPSVNISIFPQSGNTANHDIQVFWKTDQDNAFSASKSSSVVSYNAQNAWMTLNLDLNPNVGNWVSKTINQFRLDFDNNNSGTRWIVNHFINQVTPRFWFGSSTDGWNSANGLAATWWTGGGWPGVLVADQTGNDAFITRDISGYNYRGAQNDRVYVRLFPQNGATVNHNAQLFWATTSDNTFSEAKSIGPIYFTGKDTWVDLWFDVGANATWTGQGPLKAFRFDFDQGNQGVRWIVDQIQVVHNGTPGFAPYNNASIVSSSVPATVNAGQTFSATVTFNNCGNKTWTSDATAHRLGSRNPADNTRWGMSRVNLPGNVSPGANCAFTATFTAPSTVGTHPFEWMMVEDGVQWFGQVFQTTINVISPGPSAPTGVAAAATAWDKVNVTWTDASANETGFKVQRATASGGPYTQIAAVGANVTSYPDSGLSAGTAYYYRVLSYNSGGDSVASNTGSVTTPNRPPDLAAIGDKSGTEGQLIAFAASATNPNHTEATTTFGTWEGTNHGAMEVMFRKPSNSTTTSGFIDGTVTNYSMVVSNPPAGFGGARALKVEWTFKTGTTNPWIRLTTASGIGMPNPTVGLDQKLTFKIYSTKALKVGVGLRETATTAAYGANGGTTGTIEWAGVTNVVGGNPIPSKAVAASTWTTVSLNIPFEPQAAFTGDGKVDQSGAKGVLEHLVLSANGGAGTYTVYLDDIAVVTANDLAYSLDAGAPTGAAIGRRTGAFGWTPAAGQAGTYNITVRATDRLSLQDYETIKAIVIAVGNHAPVLAPLGAKSVNELTALGFSATATDMDAGSVLTYSLDAGNPSGSGINSSTGAFAWTPTEAQGPGSYPITVRVTDNGYAGNPASNDFETITVTVAEANVTPVLAVINDQTINEGQSTSVTASATDADVPANSLIYTLDVGAPAGMTINATTGVISWTTGESQGPAAYPVTVRVTDAGGLSDAKMFTVTVNEVNTAPALTLDTTRTSVQPIADFEAMASGSYNGTVMFRQPSFSSTSSGFLDAAVTNYTMVTTNYPGGDTMTKALYATWAFKTGTTNPWLRLSTYNTQVLPNPTVNFTQRLRFKIYSDKALKVALGLRESNTGADIGQNGGGTGTIEFVGVTGVVGGCPQPSRSVPAGSWQTLEFVIPTEGVASFAGDGVLTSTTGKGVLEELALVPHGGMGVYNVYVDNFEVVTVTTNFTVDTGMSVTFGATATDADFPAQALTFSLDTNTAPAGAAIDPVTGVFSWAPSSAQGPSTNVITVRVTDNGPGALSDSKNVTIVVNRVNTAPVLNLLETVMELNAGGAVTLTAEATDVDGDAVTFSLQNSPPSGATINPATGVFTWTPPNQLGAYVITVRATDNGVPPLYDDKDMTIIVTPTNTAPALTLPVAMVTEMVVDYESIVNFGNEQVMFKKPGNSTTTSNHIDMAATQFSHVTNSGVPAGNTNAGAKAMKAQWTFKTGTTNPWVRLTTYNTTLLKNPTFNLTGKIRFSIYSTKSLKVALGIRETGTTAAVGADGGATGLIEWVGATNKTANGCPLPTRTVAASNWTTVEFDLPAEPCAAFNGNGVLTNAGKGVLECLALVANGGTGAYTVYVDAFRQIYKAPLTNTVAMSVGSTLSFQAAGSDLDTPAQALNFGLTQDAPAGAAMDMVNGRFTWTPTAAGTYAVTVVVEDDPTNGATPKSASRTINVTVSADALAPQSGHGVLASVGSAEPVQLTWDSQTGVVYMIQYKAEVEGEWLDVSLVTAVGDTTTVQVQGGGLYRVVEFSARENDQ